MSNNSEVSSFLGFIQNEFGEGPWITLYKNLNKEDKSGDGTLFSCLSPVDVTKIAMENYGWDLGLGDGGPSIVTSGRNQIWYESETSDFFPLIIHRQFHGLRDSYNEISQELIRYLNLFHDRKESKYIVDDDNGNEIVVIKYSLEEIKIRKRFLNAFMSAKQMDLLLYFENTMHFQDDSDQPDKDVYDENLTYTQYSGRSYSPDYNSFVRICGKKLYRCLPRTQNNYEAMAVNKQFESFVIKGDEFDNYSFSCDPDRLANYFGKNPDSPHYLTPVFFSKVVLQKYFNASTEYEVNDSHVIKKGFWRLRLDNNHTDHVCVFLGDLGRDIPHSEQVYWKSFNIKPEGRTMSDTYFMRSMLGKPSEALSPDIVFKSTFKRFNKKWLEKYGWPLFKPLSPNDQHCLSSLHSLTSNEQSEFDSQVISLVKCTNDSINVKELKKVVTEEVTGSIKLLAAYLSIQGYTTDVSSVLGGLQGIRSTGVAHRRSTDYEKTINRLGIGENLIDAFDRILMQVVAMLTEIEGFLLSD